MNSEESRLRSFDMWPISGPVCSRKLAASGFYATGNVFEVECNWCNCRIKDWELDETIDQRHIRLSPRCDFILNRHQCGNVPSVADDQEKLNCADLHSVAEEHDTLDLLVEKDRLATFVNWPNPNITPQSLAKAGFFYRNRSDEVECAWCKGVIAQWEKQDNAFEEHRRFFPECPRMQLGPLIEIANDGIRDLGIHQISPAKNPKYISLHTRLQTFSNWPIPDIQRPEDLAQAGLYYQKVEDQVRCFHCNIGLRSWEKEDDPWYEHAKWYPMCEFVRLVKGGSYVQQVQENTRKSQTSNNHIISMTLEDAMLTEPVKLALEMGISSNTLRNKTQQIMFETGRPYGTIEDLLKSVFDDAENLNSSLENTPQTSSENPISSSNGVFTENSNIISNHNTNTGHVLNTTLTSPLTSTTYIKETSGEKSFVNPNNKLKKIEINNVSACSEINGKLTSDRKVLEEENRKLKDARLCKVCLDEEVGIVYLPCGHLVTCVQCAPSVVQCPMCRTKIKGFVRTYLS